MVDVAAALEAHIRKTTEHTMAARSIPHPINMSVKRHAESSVAISSG
jgi:hypothetical protein